MFVRVSGFIWCSWWYCKVQHSNPCTQGVHAARFIDAVVNFSSFDSHEITQSQEWFMKKDSCMQVSTQTRWSIGSLIIVIWSNSAGSCMQDSSHLFEGSNTLLCFEQLTSIILKSLRIWKFIRMNLLLVALKRTLQHKCSIQKLRRPPEVCIIPQDIDLTSQRISLHDT